MGRPQGLRNPLALTMLGRVSVARGGTYLVTYFNIGRLPPSLTDVGPSIPAVPVVAVGVVWVLIGLLLLVSLYRWRWLRMAASMTGGAYLTWALVYLGDTVAMFRWGNILSVLVYVCLFVVTLTLAQEEIRDNDGGDV